MQIGLFPGSFNPIHTGHMIIAEYMLNHYGLHEIWFIISPQNPLKRKSSLADAAIRVAMSELAVISNKKLKVSKVELDLPKPSYTIHTLDYLKAQEPYHHFSLIIGSDNYAGLTKWKSHERLIKENPILVFPRHNWPLPSDPFSEKDIYSLADKVKGSTLSADGSNIIFTKAPLIDLSSTYIRDTVRVGKSIRYLVPDSVMEFIEEKMLYQS